MSLLNRTLVRGITASAVGAVVVGLSPCLWAEPVKQPSPHVIEDVDRGSVEADESLRVLQAQAAALGGSARHRAEAEKSPRRKVTEVQNPDGSSTRTIVTHDDQGRLVRTTVTYDAQGQRTQKTVELFDAQERLLESSTTAYNAQGRRARKTRTLYRTTGERLTQDTVFTYGAQGRLAVKTENLATHDAQGTLMGSSRRVTEFARDVWGRLDTRTTTTYDAQGRRTQKEVSTYGYGRLVKTSKTSYDTQGRRTVHVVVTFNESGRAVTSTTTEYNPAGDPTRRLHEVFTGHRRRETETLFTYDAQGHLVQRTKTLSRYDAKGILKHRRTVTR